MKREEAMKNLWMISAPPVQTPVTHSAGLPKSAFVPISFDGQPVEANGESGVIPLRGFSY